MISARLAEATFSLGLHAVRLGSQVHGALTTVYNRRTGAKLDETLLARDIEPIVEPAPWSDEWLGC